MIFYIFQFKLLKVLISPDAYSANGIFFPLFYLLLALPAAPGSGPGSFVSGQAQHHCQQQAANRGASAALTV